MIRKLLLNLIYDLFSWVSIIKIDVPAKLIDDVLCTNYLHKVSATLRFHLYRKCTFEIVSIPSVSSSKAVHQFRMMPAEGLIFYCKSEVDLMNGADLEQV